MNRKNEPAGKYGVRDARTHRYAFRLNEEEHLKFEQMFEQSAATSKTKFIEHRLFG